MQMPVAPMRAKDRTERAELEPSRIQLARIFGGWNEAADVRAPVGKPRQSGVDRDGHVRLECFPTRLDIARPDQPAKSLHAGRRVAVQRERSLVRVIELRSFP